MPTWTGWRQQFERALGVTDTTDNRDFLRDWAAHSNSNCANNPVDVSHSVRGSTRCATLPGGNQAQRYTSHAQAAQAFALQLHSGKYPILLQGFQSGHPLATRAGTLLFAELVSWGSVEFAHFVDPSGGGGSGGGGTGGGSAGASHAVKAWGDLRKQVNQTLPTTLRHIDRLNRGALSHLHRRRRVRR